MPTLTIKIDQDQADALEQVLGQNPGWNKSLVIRALLAYFLKLDMAEQESLVKTHARPAKLAKDELKIVPGS